MKKTWLWVGAALLCVTLWYFARERPERLPGEGTIVEFVREGHWLSVFGGPLAKRTDLVAMEQFEPFPPGQSLAMLRDCTAKRIASQWPRRVKSAPSTIIGTGG
jgi:hypothetical protein